MKLWIIWNRIKAAIRWIFSKEKIVIVDIDDVCAWLLKRWLYQYNQDYNDNLQLEDITDWDLVQFVKPECGEKIYRYLDDETIYDEVEPIPGALEGVRALRAAGWHVLFVTANVHKKKFEWLKKWGFLPDSWESFDYACMHWKDLILADAIVDDRTSTIQKFKGRAILFDRPHNRSFHWEDLACGWASVVSKLCRR